MEASSRPRNGSLFKRHSTGDLWAGQRRARQLPKKVFIKMAADDRSLKDEEKEDGSANEDVRMDLSFSGAGFMGCYYFGVVDCWNKYIPRERVNRVTGASAGSLSAAYYLMGLPLGQCVRQVIAMMEDIRKRPFGVFDRSNQIVDVLPRELDKTFPEDAHKRVNGRLYVCMTRLRDFKCIVVNEFESKKDLIDALNCSCFIPIWSGNHVSTFRGVKHIDGGFTNNLPVFDEHTIRICCFSGTSDISPSDRARIDLIEGSINGMPFHWSWTNARRARRALFPPPASYIVGLLEQGFHDTKDFILSNDLIQCDSCYSSLRTKSELPIYQQLTPTISPAASPCSSRRSGLATGDRGLRTAKGKAKVKEESSARLEASDVGEGRGAKFRAMLEHKLQGVARPRDHEGDVDRSALSLGAPTFVIDLVEEEKEGAAKRSDPKKMTIGDIMAHQATEAQAASQSSTTSTISTMAHVSSSSSPSSSARNVSSPDRKRAKPAEPRALLGRRNTVDSNLLLADKFQFAPHPLPSCPPSPNLNRHCNECIRLRQEARLDGIDPVIKREADRYRNLEKEREELKRGSGLLVSPIKWLRQLANKSSYSFREDSSPEVIPTISNW